MKLVSWNVNGLRACMKKGFAEYVAQSDADIICVQETKMQPEQADFSFDGYEHLFWNSAERKGYSGTLIIAREQPLRVQYDIDDPQHIGEGRAITVEYKEFFLVNVYTPNSQGELARLPYRMEWEDAFRAYVTQLDKRKPVIICGDLNVAHQEIDLKNPKTNRKNAGFTDEERGKLTTLLENGFIDSFRYLYPEVTGAYSWWSYRFHARKNNAGWRIDYFLVSERLKDHIQDSQIHSDVLGSDHCPVCLELNP